MNRIISIILITVIIFVPISTSNSSDMNAQDPPLILTIDLDDMITAGTAARIERGIQEAEERDAAALVLLLDTPGGLVDSTLKIISDLSASNVPIITYVTPQGAIAASAGSFILLGGHITAMSPGTTTGAAMPVNMTPNEEETQTADDKTILFLAGHIKSIAENNGRPGDIAERFVTENLTLSSQEALELGVADYIEPNLVSLLSTIHGQEIQVQGEAIIMNTEDAIIEPIDPSLAESITHLISNPQITFILLMVGIYGIILGVNNPGTFVPEVLGSISLVLALFGLGMFEVNLFAIIMIVLGMGLLVAEALTPTYGVLGTGGIASLVIGIIYLPVEPLVTSRWLFQFRLIAIGVGVVGSVFLVILLAGIARLRKLPVKMGADEFLKELGVTMEDLDPQGLVRVKGELWKAQTQSESFVPAGTQIRVLERHQMLLIVERVDEG